MTDDSTLDIQDEATSGENQEAADDVSRERIGIFGGTFNPVHMGHLNALTTVHSRMNLAKIVVMPAARNPLKPETEGPTDQQRLDMLQLGLSEFPFLEVSDMEIKRGGASYTIDTVQEFSKTVRPEDLYLIVGLDAFEEFDKWKSFEKVLELANVIVVTRPNHTLPFSEDDLPAGLRPLVAAFDRQYVALHSGRSIEFVRLNDLDISATDVRKRLRSNRNVDRQLSIKVEEYIRDHSLFAPLGPRIGDYEAFTKFCAQALWDKKAIAVRGFDLRAAETATEFTLIASGTSTRHAQSLAEAVQRAVKEEFNVLPQSSEGAGEGRWVLLDYGSLIVHVFYDFVRQEYRLEDLWKTGRDLGLKEEVPAKAK
jgi:nicotinate-nucleotide adenylyltransferase